MMAFGTWDKHFDAVDLDVDEMKKNCENLDVDLEATACVHSLQYSTVQ